MPGYHTIFLFHVCYFAFFVFLFYFLFLQVCFALLFAFVFFGREGGVKIFSWGAGGVQEGGVKRTLACSCCSCYFGLLVLV